LAIEGESCTEALHNLEDASGEIVALEEQLSANSEKGSFPPAKCLCRCLGNLFSSEKRKRKKRSYQVAKMRKKKKL